MPRPYGEGGMCTEKGFLGKDREGEHGDSPLRGIQGAGFTRACWVRCPAGVIARSATRHDAAIPSGNRK